jgi:HTH-type transcriptional regulator / antitoxin HipB
MHLRTPKDIGLLIRDRRRDGSLSQQRLSDMVGVSRQWIVEIEHGKLRAELALVLRTLQVLGIQLAVVGSEPGEDAASIPEAVIDLDAIIERARGGRR